MRLRYPGEIAGYLAAGGIEQHFLGDFAYDVPRQDMTLLNPWRLVGRNANGAVGQVFHFAPRPGESDGVDRFLFCDLHGPQDIARISAGGNTEQDVSFFSERFQLTSKDKIKAIVVSDGGERRRLNVTDKRAADTP